MKTIRVNDFTKFLSSTGIPGTLVDKRSLFDGDKENLILSPRLITWKFMGATILLLID